MDTMKRKRQFIFNIYNISSSLYLFIYLKKKKGDTFFYQILDNLKIPIAGFSTEFVNTHTELLIRKPIKCSKNEFFKNVLRKLLIIFIKCKYSLSL